MAGDAPAADPAGLTRLVDRTRRPRVDATMGLELPVAYAIEPPAQAGPAPDPVSRSSAPSAALARLAPDERRPDSAAQPPTARTSAAAPAPSLRVDRGDDVPSRSPRLAAASPHVAIEEVLPAADGHRGAAPRPAAPAEPRPRSPVEREPAVHIEIEHLDPVAPAAPRRAPAAIREIGEQAAAPERPSAAIARALAAVATDIVPVAGSGDAPPTSKPAPRDLSAADPSHPAGRRATAPQGPVAAARPAPPAEPTVVIERIDIVSAPATATVDPLASLEGRRGGRTRAGRR